MFVKYLVWCQVFSECLIMLNIIMDDYFIVQVEDVYLVVMSKCIVIGVKEGLGRNFQGELGRFRGVLSQLEGNLFKRKYFYLLFMKQMIYRYGIDNIFVMFNEC